MRKKNFNKSKRGRRAGQLAKAHHGITSANEHVRLAAHGNFPPEVQQTAFWLTKLAKERDEILAQPRSLLAQNNRPRKILMLPLPENDSFSPNEREMLRETGLDVHWLLQRTNRQNNEPLLILSRLLHVAQNPDRAAKFFKELGRRFGADEPTDEPVERRYSRLAELKRLLESPDLRRTAVMKFPYLHDAYERGVTPSQMRKFYIEEYKKCSDTDKTLQRAAKIIGLKTPPRGRPSK